MTEPLRVAHAASAESTVANGAGGVDGDEDEGPCGRTSGVGGSVRSPPSPWLAHGPLASFGTKRTGAERVFPSSSPLAARA